MIEAGNKLDLTKEALGANRRAQLWIQNLESDLAIMLEVQSEIDRRHCAAADLSDERISAEKYAFQILQIV